MVRSIDAAPILVNISPAPPALLTASDRESRYRYEFEQSDEIGLSRAVWADEDVQSWVNFEVEILEGLKA